MDDDTLDDLLARTAPAPSPEAVNSALQLARRTAAEQRRPARRHGRLPVVIAAFAAGALLVSGAGTLTAYQLGIPPFQGTDPGSERIATPIPVEYTNSLGKQVRCQAFTEWEDLTEEQRATLNALGEDPFWVGYGDRILNSQEMQSASVLDQQQAVFDQVAEDLPRRHGGADASGAGPEHCRLPRVRHLLRSWRSQWPVGPLSPRGAAGRANPPPCWRTSSDERPTGRRRRPARRHPAGDPAKSQGAAPDDEEARLWYSASRGASWPASAAAEASQRPARPVACQLTVTGGEPDTDRIDLAAALRQLSAMDQEIIKLVHWDGFSQAEAAQLLGLPEGTLRSRHHRARQQLRGMLQGFKSPR